MAFVTTSIRTPLLSSLPRSRASALCTRRPSPPRQAARGLRPTSTSFPPRTPVSMVQQGEPAPDFTRNDSDGQSITLSHLRGSNVVLYFSNLAGPGCTSQSCTFRDSAADFAQLDARIIAVSAQPDAATVDFKRTNNLPFSVIPDPSGELQKLYAVPATLGLIPGRVTYVIDKEGVVRHIHNAQFSASHHVKVAKEALQSLK